MTKSKIEWTDRVWNPVTGCTKVSPGCANCYAERMAKRLKGRCGYEWIRPFKVTFHPNRLDEPFTWKKPSKVFVCSMGDLFHEHVVNQWIYDIMEIMSALPRHKFIILTKRPERALEFFTLTSGQFNNLPNVWLGVSAENQQTADERIPILLQVPAAVRFVSCEPLLGHINFIKEIDPLSWNGYTERNFLTGKLTNSHRDSQCATPVEKLDWIIAGGESGPGARPMHPDWARSLRDQCQAAGVPFFFKQWGEFKHCGGSLCEPGYFDKNIIALSDPKPNFPKNCLLMKRVGKKAAGRLLDGREWNEFPEAKTSPI